jgi:hypothetical protein
MIKNHRTYHSSFDQWFPNEALCIRLFLKNFNENSKKKIFNPQAALQKHPIYTMELSKHPLTRETIPLN